ncbi:MAG: hypothetical protein ACK5MA_06815 [Parachlamydiaceae bacterium]
MNPLNPIVSSNYRAQKPYLRGRELLKEMSSEQKLSSRIGNFIKGSFLVIFGSIPCRNLSS